MRRYFVPFYSKQLHTTSLWTPQTPWGTCTSWDTGRDDLCKRHPTSPELPRLNKAIQNRICVHKRQTWRDFVETMDQKTDLTKLWRSLKGIDGRAKREAENEAITFNRISFSSSKQVATKLNHQFNTSKPGRHTSSRETRVVTRETKRKPLEMVRTFTTDLVMEEIKSCSRYVKWKIQNIIILTTYNQSYRGGNK